MSSLDAARSPPIRREEMVHIALLLAFAGGYLDAYTWIIHGVMANAQTANLVLLWVQGTAGRWQEALHFVPPLAAFTLGVVVASWLRHTVGGRAGEMTILVEIVLLVTVAILHNRLPDLAGTIGISFVAAMQTAVFTKVEGATYSSVMITGNLRQAIEGLFAAAAGGSQPQMLRRSGIFASVCVAFGVGAAIGAFATKGMPNVALGLPVVALLVALLLCEARSEA
ncbi:hypothetical protein AS156_29060 [Bradyrhizobium macuxiense]|uniref:DUF1275 family protein n=1 Tax=Bradyrhizobium macuxiense TaxID=1755647 RepID=A0A109K4C7_9BRAD|nr:YoaK family protein [Bradyrhizobium macuxiense]KWV60436.1 hypothetical protein AS156_29060 [Bradyrhizobium macuxiense]